MQGEDGDPHERKKQRIHARVWFSLPTQKRRAMDDECDVGCAKRRKFAPSAESGGEMEDLQWIEHAKRMFRFEMLAERSSTTMWCVFTKHCGRPPKDNRMARINLASAKKNQHTLQS
ncbi:hypothetical protein Ae201684P_005957 [Aphanomyces euteiches]|nr:hypothetical protein Ae201684P_005957 [Aphanomyces euteiches]